LLCVIPGILLAVTGLILNVVVETDDNYWYIHSLWHIFMATAILFFLPISKSKEISESKGISTGRDGPILISPFVLIFLSVI
jgi:hypothetical protein